MPNVVIIVLVKYYYFKTSLTHNTHDRFAFSPVDLIVRVILFRVVKHLDARVKYVITRNY